MSIPSRFVLWFGQISLDDVAIVGGKNASLGEMVRELSGKGVQVPDGFAITADAYRQFLRFRGVDRQIADILEGLDTRDIANLRERGQRVRQAILSTPLPTELKVAIG